MRRISRGRKPTIFSRVNILYEDDDLIVVDKPAGLLTIATEREKERTLYAFLFDRAKRRRPPDRIFIVHRLDREASGLLVFAKTPGAKSLLQEQFRERTAGRIYKAVVDGTVPDQEGTIESYLAENRAHRSYSTTNHATGKRAVTHFRVNRRSARRTLLEVKLETGRKHQIRVHLAEMGHPIVGDKVYGSGENPLNRLALHAERLVFLHPSTKERKQFQSPCPPAFLSILGNKSRAHSRS